MMPVPAALKLVDFGTAAASPSRPSIQETQVETREKGPLNVPAEPDVTDRFEEGLQAGRSEVAEEMNALRQQFDAEIDDRLRAEREEWCTLQAAALDEQISRQFAELQTVLCSWTANVIRPVVEDLARKRVVDELWRALGPAREAATIIKVFGPEDLLDALEARFAGAGLTAQFNAQPDSEIRIEIDRTVIESCIATWLDTWGDTGQ